MHIVSIEPINEVWMIKIRNRTNQKVSYVSRDEVEKKQGVLKTADILLCRDRDVDDELIGICCNLKWIFIISAGVDKLPFELLNKEGIRVVNAPDISNQAISNYVVGAILQQACHFYELMEYQKRKEWKPFAMTDSLEGKKMLIVGAGKIGRTIAQKVRNFGIEVNGICREPRFIEGFDVVEGIDALGNWLVDSDYVVCSLPLTKETKYVFNEKVFEQMKKGALFINISRGGLVDTNALVKYASREKQFHAILDVFEMEPLAIDSELWNLKNVIITPHSSGRVSDFIDQALNIFLENVISYIREGKLLNEVDLVKGY